MATVTTDHYRAYTPRPFTRAERDSVTILFGGLHWRIERVLQAVLESSGYRAQILPVATKEDGTPLFAGDYAFDPTRVDRVRMPELAVIRRESTARPAGRP